MNRRLSTYETFLLVAADAIVVVGAGALVLWLRLGYGAASAGMVGAVIGVARANYRQAIYGRAMDRRVTETLAAEQAGLASAFATGSYRGARLARDLHAVETGRIGNRLVNKVIGRGLVSRMWSR